LEGKGMGDWKGRNKLFINGRRNDGITLGVEWKVGTICSRNKKL